MRTHRAISVLLLVSFLPLATGCTSQVTVALESDPDSWVEALSFDEPVAISGYTTRSGGFSHWRGQFQNSPPDGLVFVDENHDIDSRADQRGIFRLAREDVVSVRIRKPQGEVEPPRS